MIIDTHSHWLPLEIIQNAHFFSKAWSDIDTQIKMMEEAGIDKAVLSYPTSDAHLKMANGQAEVARIYNDTIGKLIKRYPDKFIGAMVLPVGGRQEMLDELQRALGLGFKAISLASSYNGLYLDDPMFLPIYAHAQEKKLPIFVHAQIVNPIGFERVNDPLLTPVIEYVFDTSMCIGRLLMSEVLHDYAQVTFIFANFGGVIPFLAQRFDATYQMLRGINFVKDLKGKPTDFLKHIYVDTGGDRTQANFLAALSLVGPEHVLWGSDWPAKKDVAGAIQAVRDLGISEKEKEDILGNNLLRLLEQN